MSLAVVFHRENESRGTGRVAGNVVRHDLLVAENDRLAFGDHHIVLWHGRRGTLGRFAGAATASRRMLHEIPVGLGQVNVRAVVFLEIRGAAEMVRVAVARERSS